MAQKQIPTNRPESPLPAVLETINQASQSLESIADQLKQTMREMSGQPVSDASNRSSSAASSSPSPKNSSDPNKSVPAKSDSSPDEKTRRYYERLEQTGQLMDVSETTDLTTLPPNITHVRLPDGTIRRVGYSSAGT